jgi:RNA polymerase sigma-70 factor (ECF subfamily)
MKESLLIKEQSGPSCPPEHNVRAECESADDTALMALLARGDTQAFAELMNRYLKVMVAVADRILSSRAEADEVAQEAFLRLWSYAPQWDPAGTGTPRTWLSRVVTNLCLDRCRRRRSVPLEEAAEIEDERPNALVVLQDEDRQRLVKGLLEGLPESQRAAVVLAYYEEMSGKDIAAALKLSVGAVESLLVRARRALRGAVQEAGLIWGEDV